MYDLECTEINDRIFPDWPLYRKVSGSNLTKGVCCFLEQDTSSLLISAGSTQLSVPLSTGT